MKLVFASTTYNHHQSELSKYLYDVLMEGYCFIETVPLTVERKNMNWGIQNYPKFVKCSHIDDEAMKQCISMINEADVLIWGSVPFFMIQQRLKNNKLTFHYSERLFKKGFGLGEFLPRFIKHYWQNKPKYNQYLLCASAYASYDYAKMGCYYKRMYKWGYFPETMKYDLEELIINKDSNSILWVGRLIEWKHPELAVKLAEYLNDWGVDFSLRIIGNGPMENELRRMTHQYNLEEKVIFLGSMKPLEVRKEMEKTSIFIATSDYREGWGAVINEAMNSACAVVASHAMGSVPFIIDDGMSGLIYENGNFHELLAKVLMCIENKEYANNLRKNAYKSISEVWNAKNAANTLINLVKCISREEQCEIIKGPCSIALPVEQEAMYMKIRGVHE